VHWRTRTWVLLTIIFTGVMAVWFVVHREIVIPRIGGYDRCACVTNYDWYDVLIVLLPLALWLLGIAVLFVAWLLTRVARYWASR
jgi:hypothetical protein